MKSVLVLLLLIFGLSEIGSGQRRIETKQVDRYVRQLTTYVDRPSTRVEVYANVSETARPSWRKFRSKKSLEKFRESTEVYEIAYVWRRNAKIVAVSFTFSSGSGDWAHYVFHYFRADGTIAYVDADLRTFYGNMSVLRTFYYRPTGKPITKRTEYRDIQTNRPKVPTDNFIDNKVRIYKKTNRLPFLL